jgi:hypothetical protein
MSKRQKKKGKKLSDKEKSKKGIEDEEIDEDSTKRNKVIAVAVAIVVVLVIAYIISTQPSEEEPPDTIWWTSDSYCFGAEVTDVTKARDATGWNITVYLYLDTKYQNLTLRYIIDWDDGNRTEDSPRMGAPIGYSFIGDQSNYMHFPKDAEPSKIHVVISDCD